MVSQGQVILMKSTPADNCPPCCWVYSVTTCNPTLKGVLSPAAQFKVVMDLRISILLHVDG